MSELLWEWHAVSPEMALGLSCLFGNALEFWVDAQRAVDLWDSACNMKIKIARISPLTQHDYS